jgi:hypothetical protein
MKIKESNWAVIDYLLNKYLPYVIVIGLLLLNLDLTNYALYVLFGVIIFIDRFSFNIGRSVGEYENNPCFKEKVDRKVEDED